MDRRAFLGVSGASLFCAVGGARALGSRSDVLARDAQARRATPPDPVDGLTFQTPAPQPGGLVREYWIQAVRHRADAAQQRPKRTIVRNVSSYGNVLGFSGTNMRYVTITRSKWFENGLGIVCTRHRTMRMTITVR